MLENDDLDYEGQESPDTDVTPIVMDETKQSITFGLYALLNALKNFYSRIQDNYKKVSITWLIASLIGMGFLFSQNTSDLPVSRFYIAIFIQFITMWGITLIWFIDIIIYQTYFYGVVLEEVKLEKNNKWLPNVNINIGKLQFSFKNVKKKVSQSYFYLGCQYILLIFMCIMVLNLINFEIFYSILAILLFCLVGILLKFIFLRVEHPKKKSPMANQIRKHL